MKSLDLTKVVYVALASPFLAPPMETRQWSKYLRLVCSTIWQSRISLNCLLFEKIISQERNWQAPVETKNSSPICTRSIDCVIGNNLASAVRSRYLQDLDAIIPHESITGLINEKVHLPNCCFRKTVWHTDFFCLPWNVVRICGFSLGKRRWKLLLEWCLPHLRAVSISLTHKDTCSTNTPLASYHILQYRVTPHHIRCHKYLVKSSSK